MTLKGIANKEEKNVTDIETFKIDTIFSFEVIANIYKDIGRIVIEVNAVKNEILVNTLKFSLFKNPLHLLKIMIVHLELCYNGH